MQRESSNQQEVLQIKREGVRERGVRGRGVFERKDGSWCSIRLCCCRPAGANCCCRTFLRSVGCGVQIVREG